VTYQRVPIEEPDKCGMGQGPRCCVYLMFDGEGFECGRDTPFAPQIEAQHRAGTMSAKRRPMGPFPGCQSEDGCPTCGAMLGADTMLDDDDATPSPGDIGLCAYCAEVLVFDGDLIRRRAEGDLRAEVLADPRVATARAAIEQMMAGRR